MPQPTNKKPATVAAIPGFPDALYRASLLLTSPIGLDKLLLRFAELARELVHAEYAAIAVMNTEGRILEFITAGITQAQRKAIGHLPEGLGLLGLLFHQRESIRVKDIASHPMSYGFPANHPPMRSLLGVPVIGRDNLVINLYLTNKRNADEFTEEDERLTTVLAQYAAIGIENARLREDASRSAREWRALHSVASSVISQPNSTAVMNSVVREARRFFGVDVAFIALRTSDGSELQVSASSGLRTRNMSWLRFNGDSNSPSEVGKNSYVTNEVHLAPQTMVAQEGLAAIISAELCAAEQSLGVFYVATRTPRQFSQEERSLLDAMAALAAISVLNARAREIVAEQAITAESERQRIVAIIETFPGAIMIRGPKDIELVNKAGSMMLLGKDNVSTDELNLRSWTLLHPDLSDYRPEEYPSARSLKGETLSAVEAVLRRPEGTDWPILISSAPLKNAAGRVTSAVISFQEISHLKEIERLKEEFLSMITHDLKNPLTTIKGLATGMLLEDSGIDEATRQTFIGSISEEADRLTELVNNLLDMSRLEAGALPLDREECYFEEIAQETLQRMQGQTRESGHKLLLDLPAELPRLYVDYQLIGRVLQNLVSNAIKYSPPGSTVRLRARYSRESNTIRAEVEDYGIGIPQEDQAKLFDRFFRVRSEIGRSKPGAGLGLAICKGIIDAHRGKIWVESEEGKGTTFMFSLPVDDKAS